MTTPNARRITRYLRKWVSSVTWNLGNLPLTPERRKHDETVKETLESVLDYLREPDLYDGGGHDP